MPDLLTGKPIAAVRLEGTITEGGDAAAYDVGTLRAGVKELLEDLRKTHYVIVVSGLMFACGGVGAKIALDFIVRNAVPYDELWASFGIPDADVWIDNKSKRLDDGDAETRKQ